MEITAVEVIQINPPLEFWNGDDSAEFNRLFARVQSEGAVWE